MIDRRTLMLSLAASPLAFPAMAEGGPIVAPIRLEAGRVLIDAGINGRGPFPFAIDTGAVVSGVEDAIARELGLPIVRKVKLAKREFDLFQVSELVLGGAVRQQDVALFGLKMDLRGANGLIAAGMVTTFDSTLDFERLQWRVYPGGAAERSGYQAIPSWIRQDAGANGSKRIGIEAVLDGKTVKLLVDTGMPRALVLEQDVGRRLGYWDDTRPFAPAATRRIDGLAPKPSRVLRAGLLQVGDVRFDAPIITVEDRKPIQRGYDGIIGLPVLETMNLSVDTRGDALWIRPNGRPVRRDQVSRTGLWIDKAPGGVKVSVVGTGSPAAAAGLKAGDRISGGTFNEILEVLRQDQAPITLTVEGRGPVTLVPADYL